MKRLRLPLLLAAALAAHPAPADTPSAAMPVQAREVEITGEAVPVEASGTLARRDEVDLAFPTGGIVAEVDVRAGDRVAPGRRLAALDVAEIDARLAQANAAADQARRDEERTRALYESRAVGAEAFEHAQTLRIRAEADVRAAEFVRRHAVIDAPAAGRILRRMAEPGQTVAAGQPMVGFASEAGGWLVSVALPERDVVRIREGDRARIVAPARPDEPFDAVVTHLAAGSDPRTRTTLVELAAEHVPDALRSGFTVHALIRPGPVEPRPRVPSSALVEGDGGAASLFVLAPDGSRVERRRVRIEALHGEAAYLATPLVAGTRVVERGAEFLRDGAAVTLVDEAPPPAEAGDEPH